MSSHFPFNPSLSRDSCWPDFFLPVQWLHPYSDKTKNLKESIFSTRTHIHWSISVQSTGCWVVYSWHKPVALFTVHLLTPADDYRILRSQRPCNLRVWNYWVKRLRKKKKNWCVPPCGVQCRSVPWVRSVKERVEGRACIFDSKGNVAQIL